MQNIDEIEELVRIISKLPGLGPKSAGRINLIIILFTSKNTSNQILLI
tara:strand:- start:671 stop:814 length:144 start_codon:yes stop_codon:yes gene_type:complete